jgi:undecaprenyl-diphosphatase
MTNRVFLRRTAGIAALFAFAGLLVCVVKDCTAGFDDPVRVWFYSLREPAITGVAIVITTLANKYVIIGLCLLLLILPQTRMTFGIPMSVGALVTMLMNSLIKHLVERPRPEVVHLVTEHGFSFPSGHSITSMFFYGFAIWLVWRYVDNQTARRILTVLLAIPMLLVGPTRIYLGVHFPTDVLGAWCLGFAAIVLFIEIVCIYDKKTALKPGGVE